ncbi:hypothetical protein PIB30_056864 [Stylosanthes scabra]|uniref:Uncharacterized protein n=1 Tax=Stylosanthes scabra TaxID=79078 RepID=A0ABU6SJH7_9FABA|nr:hypothetical protein [Stylosanthes scabra]
MLAEAPSPLSYRAAVVDGDHVAVAGEGRKERKFVPLFSPLSVLTTCAFRRCNHNFQPPPVFFKFAGKILLLPESAAAAAIKLWSLLSLGLIDEPLPCFLRVAVLLVVIGCGVRPCRCHYESYGVKSCCSLVRLMTLLLLESLRLGAYGCFAELVKRGINCVAGFVTYDVDVRFYEKDLQRNFRFYWERVDSPVARIDSYVHKEQGICFNTSQIDSGSARIDSPLLELNKNVSLCDETILARHESIQLSTGKDLEVFRVGRIDSRTPRIDSYPSRDEVSLSGLQGIDFHPSGIDSGPKYLKNWSFQANDLVLK